MSWLIWLQTSRLGRYVAAAGAVALFLVTFGLSQRRAGAQGAKRKAKEADHENAEQIRERADDAMRRLDGDNSHVDDQLRRLGGLRDD